MSGAMQVPLVELLRGVPKDARLVIEDGTYSTQYIPVGRYCHEAADALSAPSSEQAQQGAELKRCRHGHVHCLACMNNHPAAAAPAGSPFDKLIEAHKLATPTEALAVGVTVPRELLESIADALTKAQMFKHSTALRAALAGAAQGAKPLSKERIDFILADSFLAANGSVYSTRVYDFVAEIERAHGIAGAAQGAEAVGIYVASRASIPERPAMWQGLRFKGWPITSTWIDEAGEGETDDMGELWRRIHAEIQRSTGVLLYAEADDFPLKGALIECGIALGMGKPVAVVLPGVHLHPRSMKPLGSWAAHPLVTRYDTLEAARQALTQPPTGTEKKA